MLVGAAIALVLALVLVDRIGERLIEEEAKSAALAERDYMAAMAREQGLTALIDTMNRRERTSGGGGFRYALTDAQGRPLAGAMGLSGLSPPSASWRVVQTAANGKTTRWQVVAENLPSGSRLLVAQNLDRRRAFRTAVFQASALAIVMAAGACIAVGLGLNGMLLRRAGAIASTAERIAAGDLGARVETHEPPDVFDRLGLSLNAMLTRIDELMTGLRTVTDSIAHDLRTPLTRLKGALARALQPDLPEAERTEAIQQAHDEADRALATFSALLDIARAETGLSREMMSWVDLSTLSLGVAELFTPVIEDAGQVFNVEVPENPVVMRCHELLLRQALGNLLHNAVRHAGPGALVTLSLIDQGSETRLVVSDTGPGVPAAERGRVQERFVRLDPARTTPGSGLGLAIVAACAKLHGGRFQLEDNEPGLRAVLVLSRDRSQPEPSADLIG
jgi:signal transduction histidine kinase